MNFAEYETPCGKLLLGTQDSNLYLCDWISGNRTDKTMKRINPFLPDAGTNDDLLLMEKCVGSLDEYFAGKREFFDIPFVALGTEFQRKVWRTLLDVPYGTKTTYKAIAEAVGCPRGVRAVASAIGANPLSIFIPCHRIIGSDGNITGYAGGLYAKKYLLQLEALISLSSCR